MPLPETNRMVPGNHIGTGYATIEQWLGTAPEFDHIDEILEADVIVCGAGLAGVTATRSAVDHGASVLLFEKSTSVQGRSGDFGTVGSKVSERWGRKAEASKADILHHFMKESAWWPRARIIKAWLEECGNTLDWYISAREDLVILDHTTDPVPEDGRPWLQPARYPGPTGAIAPNDETYPSYPITAEFRPSHVPILKANLKKACADGDVRVFYETPVKKLLIDSTGRVTGVVAKSYDGKIYEAHAHNGVILATGDYSGNLDMLYWYCPWVRANPNPFTAVDRNGDYVDTGDGHRMGMWIGAQMERGPHAPMAHNMGGPLGVAPYLELDRNGERFMNEDVSGQQIENQLANLPGQISWQIFDDEWQAQLPMMPASHGVICMELNSDDVAAHKVNYTLNGPDGYITRKEFDGIFDNAEESDDGIPGSQSYYRANSLEELIKKTGMPLETALASIARYNELAESGIDTDFGKRSERMFSIKTGPFYAAKLEPSAVLVSMSGLDSDQYAHCLNAQGTPIPGLYVCGNVQGGRFAVEYSITVPGMSHSMAMTYGRIAGRNAALKI